MIHHLYLKKNVKKRKNAFLPFLLHFLLVILFLIHFLTNLISVFYVVNLLDCQLYLPENGLFSVLTLLEDCIF